MACLLVGAKPLSGAMLPYCQQIPEELISVIFFFEIQNLSFKETRLRSRLRNGGHFLGLNVLMLVQSNKTQSF